MPRLKLTGIQGTGVTRMPGRCEICGGEDGDLHGVRFVGEKDGAPYAGLVYVHALCLWDGLNQLFWLVRDLKRTAMERQAQVEVPV